MGWRRSSRDPRGTDRTGVLRKFTLQQIEGRKKALERPTAQWLAGGRTLAGLERLQTTGLIDALRLSGKQHRVSVEGDAQLVAGRTAGATRQNGCCGETGVQCAAYVF